ncbi:MAG TPA: hypothetical protein VN517_01810 [Terriglobales bacterium]|nr:hypothetical protein [Terriglobales bacterium]
MIDFAEGGMIIDLRKSMTDQESSGRKVGILQQRIRGSGLLLLGCCSVPS